MMSQECNIILSKKISRYELINWAEERNIHFTDDYSIKAIQYYLYEFKNDLILFFNESITFKVESLEINEVDEFDVEIIFEIEKCFPSFHKPDKREILLNPKNGGNLYRLNYTGFEINFKY